MSKYCALLVAADGDYVTDYHADTKDEVRRKLGDRGSHWFFYPFEFIVTPRLGRIVDAPDGLEMFKGRTVKKVLDIFKRTVRELKKDKNFSDTGVYEYLGLLRQVAMEELK